MSPTQFSCSLPSPSSIPEIVLFLNPSAPLPPSHGVVVYSSDSQGVDWKLLGAVTASSSSGVFRTGWSSDPAMSSSPSANLGVGIEPVETINNLGAVFTPAEDRRYIAKQIAKNLYNYMSSFAPGGGGGGGASDMVVPVRSFEMWIQRFDEKFSRDPSFFLKTQD